MVEDFESVAFKCMPHNVDILIIDEIGKKLTLTLNGHSTKNVPKKMILFQATTGKMKLSHEDIV